MKMQGLYPRLGRVGNRCTEGVYWNSTRHPRVPFDRGVRVPHHSFPMFPYRPVHCSLAVVQQTRRSK